MDVRSELRDELARGPRGGSTPRTGLRLSATDEAVELRVGALRAEPLVRLGPVDSGHVAALAEVPDRWPPILVAARTMFVLDGVHRVAAARRLGLERIAGTFFEGDDDDAFAAAVERNAAHGLPLSMAERNRAARCLLALSPGRSDRAIAEICGLDHKTVARLRATGRPGGEDPRAAVRIGRDRRARPLDAAALRTRIAAVVVEAPKESLRQIARRVGASPETVRDVKARLARGDDPVPHSAQPAPLLPPPAPDPLPALTSWSRDSACRSATGAAEFASWFDSGARSLEWPRFVDAVPLSRVYPVADQARLYADAWRSFADALEHRTRSRPDAT
ncbi:MAG TPA: hypothetical protein VKV36_00070 [Acidimicrobiales bacterium]|nr:hypothetical protein [Acidimicrobiales bacterium]